MCTQIQPAMGISAWKPANTPAMAHILRWRICGSFRPLAMDTENASIARPTPSRMLLKKNTKLKFIRTASDADSAKNPDMTAKSYLGSNGHSSGIASQQYMSLAI